MNRYRDLFFAMFLVIGLMAASPAYADRSTSDVISEIGIDQKLNAQLPLDLPFRNEAGETVPLGSFFKEKPVILILAYYRCPTLCSRVLNGTVMALRPVQFDIGNEFDIVTISIDPNESPELAAEKKAAYVADYARPGAERGWHFLTGPQESITKLAETVGFRYVYDPVSTQYAHTGGIMVITPTGRVSKYFYGVDYSSNDLRLGLVEASNNNIGTLVDAIKLACFEYDPATGKYSLLILRVLQIAGTLTLGALVTFIVVSARRDKNKKATAGVA